MTGTELAYYAKSKLGTPYFYGTKMNKLTEARMLSLHSLYPQTVSNSYMAKARRQGQVNKINTDCSGLIYGYTGRMLGSAQLYSTAKARLNIDEYNKFAKGVVLWREGHVGVYIGDGKVVEAKGINYGVVETDIKTGKWKCGLTFDYLEYDYGDKVNNISTRQNNPYPEPTKTLGKGCKGDDVKWLQFELCACGYKLTIDGSFGNKTLSALKSFQQSAKLVVDGKCGPKTRKALLCK